MANVLLLIPTNSLPDTAAREAIELAKVRGGTLLIVAAIDPAALERVSTTLDEEGLMGERIGDSVRETLRREYHTRAEALVQEMAERARTEGVATRVLVEEGDPENICRRLVPAHAIQVVVLIVERRSWLTRLLSRTEIRLPELAGCEVRVVEEAE